MTAAELLFTNGLNIVGVAKKAIHKFPMAYLAAQVLENRGLYTLVRQRTDEDQYKLIS